MVQGAPGLAWVKPVLQVHAPVPLMPWLQMPPRPHAHGWQVGPKKPAAHWLQTPPTATKPPGHVAVHVRVIVLRTKPAGQDVHWVADTAHVGQLLSQTVHLPSPAAKVPAGH